MKTPKNKTLAPRRTTRLKTKRNFPWHSQVQRWLFLDGLFVAAWLAIVTVLWFSRKNHLDLLPDVLGQNTTITADSIYQSVNQKRAEQGTVALQWNDTLAQAAQAKAQDMLARNYWSHATPDGKQPWTFVESAGYHYRIAGENLARNFSSTSGVVDAWLNSPTHRANLLHTAYQETGIAAVSGKMDGRDTVLIVQMFGTPSGGGRAGSNNPSASAPVGEIPGEATSISRWLATDQAIPSVQTSPTLPAILGLSVATNPINWYRLGMLSILGVALILLIVDSFHPRHRLRYRGHPLFLPSKHAAHVVLLIATLVTVGLAEVGSLL